MKSWSVLNEAILGWVKIVRGQAGWAHHFSLTMPGLVSTLVLFAIFAFLVVIIASFSVGVPTLSGFISVMLAQFLSVVALVLGLKATQLAVPSEAPLPQILVPGIYALIFYLVVGTLFALIGGPLLILLWLALAFLLYRLGRVATGWTMGVSVAFAVLTLVLLVGLPLTLYMLTGPIDVPTA